MKNFGKKFLASLLAVAQIITFTPVNNLTAFAADGDGNDITTDNNGFKTSFDASTGTLTVSPDKEDGNEHTVVGTDLWKNVKDDIKTVIFEEGITKIGESFGNTNADNACKNLKKVVLPASLTDIGGHAFTNCTSLTDIDFSKCKNLKNINDSDPHNSGELSEFSNCTSLKKVDMSGCTSLEKIWYWGFSNCTNLETVILPSNLKTIGEEAFKNCPKLSTITYKENESGKNKFPDSLTYIDVSAFENDTALTNIDLNKVQTIKVQAFRESGLTEIDLPDSLTHIEPRAFNMCNNLHKISGGKGIQDNLADDVTHNTIDPNYKHDGKDILGVADYFGANEDYTGYPLSPYHKNEIFTYTNVDDAVDCIKYGNWRLARRYQFEVKWIDATRKVWKDEDHVFDGYTAYFDYYNYKMQGKNSETTNAPTDEVIKPNKEYKEYDGRGTDYSEHEVDGKILIPSDEWKLSKDENGKKVDITTDTTMDDIKENMDGHTINLYLTDYTTKYKVTYNYKYGAMSQDATESQLYNPDETLKDIPNPKTAGKTFMYWLDDKGNKVEINETTPVTRNITYTAIYNNASVSYRFYYIPNDGRKETISFSNRVKPSVQKMCIAGTKLTDIPSTEDVTDEYGYVYKFKGWYNTEEYDELTDENKVTVDETVIIKEGTNNFYGIYQQANSVTYQYKTTNGMVLQDERTAKVLDTLGDSYEDAPATIEKNGTTYTFSKWIDSADYSEVTLSKDTVVTGSKTYIAQYVAPQTNSFGFYTAYADENNAIKRISNASFMSVVVGSKIDFPEKDSTVNLNGDIYIFKGWVKGRLTYSDTIENVSYLDTTNYICKADDTAFTAVYVPKEKCTVRFIAKDSEGNDKVLDDFTEKVDDGTPINLPSRYPLFAYDEYTKDGKSYELVDGWYKNNTDKYNYNAEVTITEDTDFYAHYKEVEPTKYTITILNDDDSTIKTFEVEENNSFNYSTKPISATDSSKEFYGWTYDDGIIEGVDISISNVTKNLTFRAVYLVKPKTYTVIFKPENGDADTVKTNVASGTSMSTLKPADPTRNYDLFLGWYKNNTNIIDEYITADTTYIAKYTVRHIVKFVGFDEESSDKDAYVDDGSTYRDTTEAIYDEYITEDFIPTKTGKTFKGWKVSDTNEIVSTKDAIDRVITEDTTFTATFEDNIVNLTFRFFDADNTLIKTSTVMQLSTTFADIPKPDSNPTKDGYTFKGWRAESDIVKDTDVFSEDTDFYPVFEENAPEKVTARFIDYDDTELDSKEVTKGTTLGDITFIPSRQEDDNFTYTFKAWTVDNNEVTDDYVINEDTTFKATYTATPKQTTPVEPDPDVTITVTFKPENGETDTIKTDVVSGSALGTVKIADPVKAEDDKFTYTFAGWKVEENDAVVDDSYVINKDTVFIATYTATRKTYHVIFKDEDGTIIEEKDVPTNTPLGDIKPNDPSKEGKDFKGWDDGTGIKPDDTPITKDTTFTATYESKELPPTPTPEPVIPTPTPTPTPEPVIPTPTPTPTPEKPKETVTIKFYLDYDLTELFDTVVVNKGEAFTYNKEPEGYKFWINVDQYVENRVYHNGETIYPMKDMTFYMEKEIKDTPDDSKVIDKPKKDDTPIKDTPKDTPKDNKKVPTPKDNPKEDNKKKEDRDIPKTGDRVLIYVLGLIAGLAILKKKKKDND